MGSGDDLKRDLFDELIYLRKARGFTVDRLERTELLRSQLGGSDETFESMRLRFVSAVQSLREPDEALLLNAFGLTPESAALATLTARRAFYGKTMLTSGERGIDTVAAQEDAALRNLQVQLLTGWYPMSPLGVRVPEIHNSLIMESVEIITVIRDRIWQENREHYRFLTLFDEARSITISSTNPLIAVPADEGWRMVTEQAPNGFDHEFYPPEPFRRGQVYDLRYTFVQNPEFGEPEAITETSLAFHQRTLAASFEVIFIGAKPERIWKVDRLTQVQRPGEPTSANTLSFKDGGSSVRARWRDLQDGLYCGVAWEW